MEGPHHQLERPQWRLMVEGPHQQLERPQSRLMVEGPHQQSERPQSRLMVERFIRTNQAYEYLSNLGSGVRLVPTRTQCTDDANPIRSVPVPAWK